MAGDGPLIDALRDAGLRPAGPLSAQAGVDISAAFRLPTEDGTVFLKTGPESELDMFTAERDALLELASAGEVRVPRPLVADTAGGRAFLALEWLELGPADAAANRAFGRALARLHRHTADAFGWQRDNTIGRTPQPNAKTDDWLEFWRGQRLGHQLELAAANGYRGRLQHDAERVCAGLAHWFEDYSPQPSLLHGDLWGGNWAVCAGEPVMFDPATYYGDRETDLAMTRLFGGFTRDFYAAYEQEWPLAAGADARLPLYQLYHVLNHLNLFGTGYLGRAESLLAGLCRQI